MTIHVWQGANTSPQFESPRFNLGILNHAMITMTTYPVTTVYRWTQDTIWDPSSWPLRPFVQFDSSSTPVMITNRLGRSPAASLSKTIDFNNNSTAIQRFANISKLATGLSNQGSSKYGNNPNNISIGDHSVEGCYFLATKFLGLENKTYNNITSFTVNEREFKNMAGRRVSKTDLPPPLTLSPPIEYKVTKEFSGASLINRLTNIGFNVVR